MTLALWLIVIWLCIMTVGNFWYAEAIARRIDRQIGPEKGKEGL